MRRAAALIAPALLALTVASGCGGDGGRKPEGTVQRSNAGDSKGAESAVRDYLRALVDHDGAKACGKLTPDYQQSVVDQNRDFARKVGAKDCASLVTAVTRQAPRTTFEGRPLNAKTVDKIPLRTTVRQSGTEQNATVTGTQGLQRYELFTANGKWWISEITQAGG